MFAVVLFSALSWSPQAPAARAARAAHGMRSANVVMDLNVGVLAIQGGFAEHMAALERQGGVTASEIRTPEQLAKVDALILPGGESTAIGHGIVDAELLQPLIEFVKNKPTWGVCAGLILLADKLDSGATAGAIQASDQERQPLIGGLDITVKRNAFGRQIDSAFREMSLSGAAAGAVGEEAYFIRAPSVMETGDKVEVLATLGDDIVAVKQDSLMATCFHPEISSDDTWLQFFLKSVCGAETAPLAAPPAVTAVAPWCAVEGEGVGSTAVKRAFSVFQKGGVIMDVVDGKQAKLAEAAGAVAVMALERIPADIKADGGVARSSDPLMIKDVMDSCSLPVMAKARIGHMYEAKILEALAVDCIDESEVLAPPPPPCSPPTAVRLPLSLAASPPLPSCPPLLFTAVGLLAGAHRRRRDQPHRQAPLQHPLRVRRAGPR